MRFDLFGGGLDMDQLVTLFEVCSIDGIVPEAGLLLTFCHCPTPLCAIQHPYYTLTAVINRTPVLAFLCIADDCRSHTLIILCAEVLVLSVLWRHFGHFHQSVR